MIPLDDPFWSDTVEAAELRRDLEQLPGRGLAALATIRRAHSPAHAQAAFAAVPHLLVLLEPQSERHAWPAATTQTLAQLEIERIRRIQLPDPRVEPAYRQGLDAVRRAFPRTWQNTPHERDRLLVAAALFGGLTDIAHRLHWVFERAACPRCSTAFPAPRGPDLDLAGQAAVLRRVRDETLRLPDLVALARPVDRDVAGLLHAQHHEIPCDFCDAYLPDVPLPDRHWTPEDVRKMALGFDADTEPLELWTVWTVLGEERVREDPVLADRIRAMTAARSAETRSRAFQILEESAVSGLAELARNRMTTETDPAVQKQIVHVAAAHDDFDGLQVAMDQEGLLGVFAIFTLARRANDLPEDLALSTLLRVVDLCSSDLEDPTAPAWEVVQRGERTVPIASPHWVANQAAKVLQTVPSRLLSRAAARWDALLAAPSPPLEGLVVLGAQLGRPQFAEAVRALRRSGRPLDRPGIGPVLEAHGMAPDRR